MIRYFLFLSVIWGGIQSGAADFRVAVRMGHNERTYELSLNGNKKELSETSEKNESKKLQLSERNGQFLTRTVERVFGEKSHQIQMCSSSYILVQDIKADRLTVACMGSSTKVSEAATRLANSLVTAFQFL